MEASETKCSLGYGKPPWIFRGRALYQFHLVKAETARAFIPKEFRLVEAFGYTLGGFFLANYDDSPTGAFDELVVIAGIVWNPPTSCAWAARVFVNSGEACHHGRKDVGLPSQVARFSKRITAIPRQSKSRFSSFLNMIGINATHHHPKGCMDLQVTEVAGSDAADICNIKLATDMPEMKRKWKGPTIKMSLPSFSGCTQYNRRLLKYSCHIQCSVQAVQPAKVIGPYQASENGREQSSRDSDAIKTTTEELTDNERNLSIAVMLSKPILALEFNCLKMRVEAPIVVSHCSESSLGAS